RAGHLAEQHLVLVGLAGVGVEPADRDVVDAGAEPLADQPGDQPELAVEGAQVVALAAARLTGERLRLVPAGPARLLQRLLDLLEARVRLELPLADERGEVGLRTLIGVQLFEELLAWVGVA